MRSLFHELQLPIVQVLALYCDNSGAVQLSANPVLHARTKHVEIDLHFIRDHVFHNNVSVRHIPALEQPADVLTKSVVTDLIYKFRSKLNILSLSMLSLKEGIRDKN